MKKFLLLTLSLTAAASLSAAMIPFTIEGMAGTGLLPGNSTHTNTSSANGGIYTGTGTNGLNYNTNTMTLTYDVAWGDDFGFDDLESDLDTSIAGGIHIHSPAGENDTAPVLFSLNQSQNDPDVNYVVNDIRNNGRDARFSGTIALDLTEEEQLMNGQFYINVHSMDLSAGEIRGNMVPEPSTYAMFAGIFALGLALWRRRR